VGIPARQLEKGTPFGALIELAGRGDKDLMAEVSRFIRGVVDEASEINTDEGTYKRITVVAPRAVDEETGTIIKTLRRACIFGKCISAVSLSPRLSCWH
jgi:hypothetical protein